MSLNLYPSAKPTSSTTDVQVVMGTPSEISMNPNLYHSGPIEQAPVVVGTPAGVLQQTMPQPRAPAMPQAEALENLSARGFPRGLAKEVHSSTTSFPIRLWVVDNSGSMNMADGSRLVAVAGGGSKMVKCTRWQELNETLGAIADMAEAVGGRTDFLLLNPPAGGPQHVSVGGDSSGVPIARLGPVVGAGQMNTLMRAITPSGTTPLTEAVIQIISLIQPAAADLRARGEQAVVVLATDGLPNDPNSFLQAVQQLQQLPVWLVVRLCTNDDNVVEYWSDLDKALEAPLEVLDDEAGEAAEIRQHNPWLGYGPPLHLARAFGLRNRLFDLLDEAPLMPSQTRELCELLLGCGPLPEPELEWASFMTQLKVALTSAPSTVDPRTGRRCAWIDTVRIGTLHGGCLMLPLGCLANHCALS